MTNVVDGFPLAWPQGWARTAPHKQVKSPFQVSFHQTLRELQQELKRLGSTSVVISSNVPLRQDGLPYSNFGSRRIDDPGVAVYFQRQNRSLVIACDTYRDTTGNLRGIQKTIEAMRAIERHGAAELLDRTFDGFKALPPPPAKKHWTEVLGVSMMASPEIIRAAYLTLIRLHHPDAGGSTARAAEITCAYQEAKDELDAKARPS